VRQIGIRWNPCHRTYKAGVFRLKLVESMLIGIEFDMLGFFFPPFNLFPLFQIFFFNFYFILIDLFLLYKIKTKKGIFNLKRKRKMSVYCHVNKFLTHILFSIVSNCHVIKMMT
jgi:hypothetical protein